MKFDLDSIKKNLMIKYPLFGSVLANTKFVEDDSVGTAGTDGDTIYYSPTFLSGLNEKEQTFILAHEICHIAFDHVFRSEGKDKDLWNTATDAVVNALLQQDGLPLVGEGVNIPEAVNYNAEQMYEKLLQEKQQKQNGNKGKPQENKNNNNQGNGQSSDNSQTNNNQNSNNNSEGNNQNNSQNSNDQKNENSQGNGSGGQDDSNQRNSQSDSSGSNTVSNPHDMWEKAVEKRNNQNGNSQEEEKEEKTSIFERLFNRNKKKEEKKNEEIKKAEEQAQKKKEEHIQKLTSAGEVKSFEKNKIARKKQLEELMNSIADESHGAGSGTNRDIREIGDIGVANPLIDWRRLLKEAVKFDIDWSYENATVEEGVVTAHLEELPKPETEIVLDTSGSIDTNLLRNFLRECKNILQTSKVKVGCFDDEFYGFTEIRNIRDIDNMKFTGGGGTNFNAAVNAFTRRVENKIIFTDGCASMPSTAIDAIWVVFGNRKINPKGGKVIYINDEQLKKLNSRKSFSSNNR